MISIFFISNSSFNFKNLYLLFFFFLLNCSDNSDIPPSSFEINVLVEGLGTISSSTLNVDANTTISITAAPYKGYYFDRWEGLGEVNESETLDLLVNQAYVLTAIFLPFPNFG